MGAVVAYLRPLPQERQEMEPFMMWVFDLLTILFLVVVVYMLACMVLITIRAAIEERKGKGNDKSGNSN